MTMSKPHELIKSELVKAYVNHSAQPKYALGIYHAKSCEEANADLLEAQKHRRFMKGRVYQEETGSWMLEIYLNIAGTRFEHEGFSKQSHV